MIDSKIPGRAGQRLQGAGRHFGHHSDERQHSQRGELPARHIQRIRQLLQQQSSTSPSYKSRLTHAAGQRDAAEPAVNGAGRRSRQHSQVMNRLRSAEELGYAEACSSAARAYNTTAAWQPCSTLKRARTRTLSAIYEVDRSWRHSKSILPFSSYSYD